MKALDTKALYNGRCLDRCQRKKNRFFFQDWTAWVLRKGGRSKHLLPVPAGASKK